MAEFYHISGNAFMGIGHTDIYTRGLFHVVYLTTTAPLISNGSGTSWYMYTIIGSPSGTAYNGYYLHAGDGYWTVTC
jgi:hypothetical protein